MDAAILKNNKKLWVVFSFLLVLAILPSIYFYSKYRQAQLLLKDPKLFTEQNSQKIIEMVGKLIELPTGEEPTVATVNDKEKLKDQPFFAKTENGDQVLVYNIAKRAILYRPSTNRIVDVTAINISTPSPTSGKVAGAATAGTPTQAQSFRVTLLNGTTNTGLVESFEQSLLQEQPNAIILRRDSAKKQDYPTSFLINVTGKNTTRANELSTSLGIGLSQMPPGESVGSPSADFVIILGSDQL